MKIKWCFIMGFISLKCFFPTTQQIKSNRRPSLVYNKYINNKKNALIMGLLARELIVHILIIFFFLIYVGCPDQFTRTTTIPHGPLDILQAQKQVRHRGGDRRAHRGSNPGRGRNKSHDWPQQLDPQVHIYSYFIMRWGWFVMIRRWLKSPPLFSLLNNCDNLANFPFILFLF